MSHSKTESITFQNHPKSLIKNKLVLKRIVVCVFFFLRIKMYRAFNLVGPSVRFL